MPSKTNISYTGPNGVVVNPVTGCNECSPGCKNCFSRECFPRFYPGRDFHDVRTHPERLGAMARMKKPRVMMMETMGDLFHDNVPDDFIDATFGFMAAGREHVHILFTKREGRVEAWHNRLKRLGNDVSQGLTGEPLAYVTKQALYLESQCQDATAPGKPGPLHRSNPLTNTGWPPRNIVFGPSVENQETANQRIPVFADLNWPLFAVSYAPALGPLDLSRWLPKNHPEALLRCSRGEQRCSECPDRTCCDNTTKGLAWVVAEGETGKNRRECEIQWIKDVANQCMDAHVPFYVKQDSAFSPEQKGRIPGWLWKLKQVPWGMREEKTK